ncbi:hypothetical protein P3W85_25245 [Cupriavidus basilensis]|uniref:Uncharacterized protein n=1 Tax=Cupriavidus basilensis TaxID=68895 RepID=A0ABT6AVD1_9BURK|nr:hypothetical protein [Cupriavidus basilensis]MDF3836232.1 hypothetical protein [Cupriavidus basilensis]
MADTSIAYLDESTQTTLWPQIWNHADLVAYYLPTEGIEGEAQKTRPRLQLFTCWVGTTCIPAPRFEMESSLIVHKVTAKAQVLQGAAGQPLKLRFELPEAPAPHYYFSHSELRAPANALWRVPMFAGWDRELSSDGRRRFAWQRKQPLSIALVLAEKDTVGYQLVDLGVRTPGQLDHYGDPLAATTMRASLSGPDGRVRQLSWPGQLSQELSQRLLASPDLARTGRIPADLKRNQFPERLSSFHAKERISTVVMPNSTPRWHGLKHYNAPEGVLLVLMQSGPIAQVELMAEAGTERAIEGNVPVKRETWMFFNGKPMRYRGQMQYGNNADHMPDTKWRVDWVDGVRLDAMAANVSPSFLVKRVPDCRWQGCRDNLAEAKAQLAASDAQLQSEGERYLRLAREGN